MNQQEKALGEYVKAIDELHYALQFFGDAAEKPPQDCKPHELWAARSIISATIEVNALLRQFHDWQRCLDCGKSYNVNMYPMCCPHCKAETAPF